MTAEDLSARVEGCLAALESLEEDLRANVRALWEAEDRVADARGALDTAERRLLIAGVEGRNEAERRARLHEGSLDERDALSAAERALAAARRDRDELAVVLDVVKARLDGLSLLARVRES